MLNVCKSKASEHTISDKLWSKSKEATTQSQWKSIRYFFSHFTVWQTIKSSLQKLHYLWRNQSFESESVYLVLRTGLNDLLMNSKFGSRIRLNQINTHCTEGFFSDIFWPVPHINLLYEFTRLEFKRMNHKDHVFDTFTFLCNLFETRKCQPPCELFAWKRTSTMKKKSYRFVQHKGE